MARTRNARPAFPARSPSPSALRRRAGRPGPLPEHALETLEQRALLAADPVTSAHPVWFAVRGTPTVDGVIRASEWARAIPVTRAQPNDHDSSVTVRVMWDDSGLYVSADIRDDQVWADGNGAGSGNWWEFHEDDAISFFFDPTRNRFFSPKGRRFGYNPGPQNGAISGPGVVSRNSYVMGDGRGNHTPVHDGGHAEPGMAWASKIKGRANNNRKPDVGWTTELFMPWSALGRRAAPRNGQSTNMNFDVYFDNDGATRNGNYYGTHPDPDLRLGPRVHDDMIHAVHSSYVNNNPGMEGPVNYAQLVFVDPEVSEAPRAVGDLSVSAVSGYGARLDFIAPATAPRGRGGAHAYQIRLSPTPIASEADWAAAAPVDNGFVPHMARQRESLRIGELAPGTTYHVAVRAVDAAGRAGPFRTSSFTTLTAEQDPSGGNRLFPAPGGSGLATESGQPFTMIGGTVGVPSLYVRNLYPGFMWSNSKLRDFTQQPGVEGSAASYFQALRSYNVNTLRVQLERLDVPAERQGMFPDGAPWLEHPAGNFNPAMKQFLHSMLEEADRAGMYFILQTFNSFNYIDFFHLTPYAKRNGGPLDRIEDFYQDPQVLEMAKNRMSVLAQWVRESPHAHRMLGFELVNEWDGLAGQQGEADLTRIRDASRFMVALGQHLRTVAPELNVMSATIGLVPRGPMARAVFQSDAFDVLDPHFYVPSTNEPVNNPDADKSVRPAIDVGALAGYWLTNRRDNRPVHNAEWDLVGNRWPNHAIYYTGISDHAVAGKPYHLHQDEAIYRTTTWVSLASGLAGAGLRIGGSGLRDLYNAGGIPAEPGGAAAVPLSPAMRRTQRAAWEFFADDSLGLDWNNFDHAPLHGRLKFPRAGGKKLMAWGVSDADQGVVYVLKNGNGPAGAVTGARLGIEGLRTRRSYNVQFWTTDGDILSTISANANAAGRLVFSLPSFTTDVMIKFVAA